jgi:hypothetical protein
LRDAGILVKNVAAWHPLLANCLRITIGTPAENDALLAALTRYQLTLPPNLPIAPRASSATRAKRGLPLN